jgi:type I restriction enzyme S subunit
MKSVKLNSVCEVIAGQSPPSSTYNQENKGIPFFQGKADFGDLYPTVRYWCDEPKKISVPNDILFSVRAPVGPTNINNIEACIGRGLSAIRCGNEINMKFLLHYLRANEEQIAALGTGSTFKAITISNLKDLEIPLPPLATQKKIAAILDEADKVRQLNKKLIAKYEALNQSLFLDMFGDPVTNPMGWEKVKLGELNKITSGSTPSRMDESLFEGTIPWVKTGEVKGKLIVKTSECISQIALENSSCKLYPVGSIVIAMYGQGKTRGQVGMLGIPATTNQACAVLPPSELMNYSYLLELLKLSYDDLRSLGRGGNQPNLNTGLVKSYLVINPPITLQNLFAERIQAIEAQKAQAQQALEKSEALFNSLLQRAFKGELVEC